MKPPLTNPPPDLERGADYDTPDTYARIGRALMLFLFTAASDKANAKRMAWLRDGITRTNGAALFDDHGMTLDPSADRSHWMNPRGSWGTGARASHAAVEWRCGWCGAENDTKEAKAPCRERA
ncbi:MAG: hypothetical protein ACLQB4_05960 [Beijerinckiaceae bacterium]